MSPVFDGLAKALFAVKKCSKFLRGFLRGTYYILFYRLKSRKIRIAFPFYSRGPVRIEGPGTVVIGKKCRVMLSVYRGLTVVTKSPQSKVIIGASCSLGGLTIRCTDEVLIGESTRTAFCLVDDSFYDTAGGADPSRLSTGSKGISIGNNVWINSYCLVLGGSKIGDDSILSSGTCCHDTQFDEYRVVIGNPATKSLPIENVLALRERR